MIILNGISLDYSLACSVICIDYDLIKGFKSPGLPACGLPPVGGLPYSSLGIICLKPEFDSLIFMLKDCFYIRWNKK